MWIFNLQNMMKVEKLEHLSLKRLVRDMPEDRKMNLVELNVLLVYADDIVIMGISRDNVIQTTRNLLKSNKTMGKEVYQHKIKYMCMTRTEADFLES